MSFMLLKFIRWCSIHRLGRGVQLIGFILLFVLLQLHASLLVVNNILQFFIQSEILFWCYLGFECNIYARWSEK
jgi:hypothetical protein